jgi:GNAT superfamily N-acetyltransferase
MITIEVVRSRKALRQFIDFPAKLYRNNPYFTPYIFEDELKNLNPKLNPASEYCDFRLFLAKRSGQIVGRVAAIINRFSNEKYQEKRIRFNRIDFIDDFAVFEALMTAVSDYGKTHGMTQMAGPLGYSDQDKEGLLTFGFEEKNMFVTFYTAAYYVQHFEAYGFKKDATWHEYQIKVPTVVPETLKKISRRILERHKLHMVKVKSKRSKHLAPYIKQVFRLMNQTYDHLYGYVPVKDDLMDMLAKQYIPLVNLDFIQLVCDEQERLVAFGLMIPSPVDALKRSKGHLFPFGFIDFFRQLKRSKVLDMLLIAVDPALKNSGVLALIFTEAIEAASRHGITLAETGPELETNQQVQSLWKHFDHRHHKSRSAFVKDIV